jgi:hypothetical protein
MKKWKAKTPQQIKNSAEIEALGKALDTLTEDDYKEIMEVVTAKMMADIASERLKRRENSPIYGPTF